MKTILAPIDFSPVSSLVIDEAIALARGADARLVLLNVVQPPSVTDPALAAQMTADMVAVSSEVAKKQLSALQRDLVARGVTVETKQMVGFPGQRIADTATTLKADYIVLGSHGHGALYDLMVGSTTSRVLKEASCPVVVVPPTREKKHR